MVRIGVVGFVAMHIHHQATVRSNSTECFHGAATVIVGSFKVRDSSHDIYAKIQRPFQERDGIRIPKVTVLWKSHQLEKK